MSKKNLKMRVVAAPTPTVIAAAYDENGKADACTLAFYSPIIHVPPCVVIGINATQKRKTLKSILSSGAFTIGYPSTDQVKEADYIGVVSGYDDILQTVKRILSEPAYKDSACKVSESFRACGGAVEARTFLEELVMDASH